MPETMQEIAKENVGIQPIVEPKVETPPVPPEEDLVSRASKVKLEAMKPLDEDRFDVKDIEKITDPVAKKYAETAYKSFQRGFNQKFQEIAELRKSLEAQKEQSTTWTPDRVKQLTEDPKFVEAAKVVMASQAPTGSGLTDAEYSALSASEKQQLNSMQSELQQLRLQSIQQGLKQQDEHISKKYANYDAKAVDIITNELLTGKVQATREDLWKVYDYENAVKRAYELGRTDAVPGIAERTSASAYDGLQITRPSQAESPKEGESNTKAWGRIVLDNLAKARGMK